MMGSSSNLGDMVGMSEELMNKAYSAAMKDHKSEKFRREKPSKEVVIFSFPGSWSVRDWYSNGSFGATKINQEFFPSLRSIGNDEFATVNEALQERFNKLIKDNSQFQKEVRKAVNSEKQVIFTGHSSGGPIAMLATIWFLEERRKEKNPLRPYCVTFGSPLVGNFIFSHALRREKWSNQFIHFVMRYDIVPRVLLAPPLQQFEKVLNSFKQQSKKGQANVVEETFFKEVSSFFKEVMFHALKTTSHVASKLKESTNLLLETLKGFIEFSPYRPFGTYIFCNGEGKIVTLKNPDAVLQFLFYSSQLSSDRDDEAIRRSLSDHFDYTKSLNKQAVVSLDSLEIEDRDMINQAFDEFGVDVKGRLCLLAAEESEKRKERNKNKIDSKKQDIEKALAEIDDYRKKREGPKFGYYDAFKLQKKQEDFKANVNRLELAGIWDEIIEMLKKYELPDNFEGINEWVKLGTRFRRLVEPLDIANYYRHQKNDTGAYMVIGRPRRYRYTQRWREHEELMKKESSGESCFWAEVEELLATGITPDTYERAKDVVEKVEQWEKNDEIERDVFLSETTFVKWWKGTQIKSDPIDKVVSG